MLKSLGDPYFVANFQRTFGLREVRREKDVTSSVRDNKDSLSPASNGHLPDGYLAQSNHVHTDTSNRVLHHNGFNKAGPFEKVRSPSEEKPEQLYKFNSFYHALFVFGSTLGYESFYLTFFPFMFWNIDEYLARRTVIMWAVIMYIGQGAKDVIQWPRPPCPPVISVEKRFQVEYGMPSTHAMVGTLIPFCLVYFTYDRYQVSLCLYVFSLVYSAFFSCQTDELMFSDSTGGFISSL